MKKVRISALLLLCFGLVVLAFDYYSQVPGQGFISKFPFKLGLDLSGGSHLVYQADLSSSGAVGGVKDLVVSSSEGRECQVLSIGDRESAIG